MDLCHDLDSSDSVSLSGLSHLYQYVFSSLGNVKPAQRNAAPVPYLPAWCSPLLTCKQKADQITADSGAIAQVQNLTASSCWTLSESFRPSLFFYL